MLIITADDFGKTSHATDNILLCYSEKAITSASAMVFMEDSTRAATLAKGIDLEVGLHLNFTLPFTAPNINPELRKHQTRIISYLAGGTLPQVLYNPFLRTSFAVDFRSQNEEFLRLYGRPPDFYNGHHHMHLCTNFLSYKILPAGARVRRTFTFSASEKGLFNRLYRTFLDLRIDRRYISTDFFFNLKPISDTERLRKIVARATEKNVEIEVHPENPDEYKFLLGKEFQDLLNSVDRGCFLRLAPRINPLECPR
jgi:predicted glycoside hydrolase/deacetylase ChbG (UPF0249 family)